MRGALANHEAGRPTGVAESLVSTLTDHHTWGRVLADSGLTSPDDLLADLMGDCDIERRWFAGTVG